MFVDEVGFLTQPLRQSTWGALGQTPVIRIAGRGWKKISGAGAIAISPGDRSGRRRRMASYFRLFDRDIDGERCAEFVRGLLREVRGPITLLWDGLAVHRSMPVKMLLSKHPRLAVHRLPAYGPELNPVEPMWGHSKGVGLRGFVPEDVDELHIEAECVLDAIGENQRLLRSFVAATPLTIPGITK